MKTMNYDLAVIGGGPGGYVTAIKGAQLGLKVLLVERRQLGGTCLNRGCIPTKCFIYDSKLFQAAKRSRVLAGTDSLTLDPLKMMQRKQKVVNKMVAGLNHILDTHDIRIVRGTGHLLGPGRLRIEGSEAPDEMVQANHIVLANGSRPAVLPFVEVDGHYVQTTDEALDTADIPDRLMIIGGGVIGVEMAAVFLNLGTQVAIVELLPDILYTEDQEVRRHMRDLLTRAGAVLHLGAKAKAIEMVDNHVVLTVETAAGDLITLEGDRLLVATGRSPVLDGIDVEGLSLKMEGPFIKVNQRLQTSLPGVYAIGDLIGGMMLAHKASADAEAAVAAIAGHAGAAVPRPVPRCIWGMTEIGAIGMSEEAARATGRRIRIGRFPFNASGAAQAMDRANGFAKIVADAENGEILGLHVIGEHATDLVGYGATTMTMEAAIEDLSAAVQAHPTLSEILMEAALDWGGQAIHLPKRKPS